MDNIKIGKFLSLILRHKPENIGLELDQNGWADLEILLLKLKKTKYAISMHTLEEIVETNDKQRFCFNDEKTKIRANQGHSINVDVNLKVTVPPTVLYHGTAEKFCESILSEGLLKQRRNHVHLSSDLNIAISVGKRHGKPIVLQIDALAMHRDGFLFYLSENQVWLTDNVPKKYIKFID